MTQNIQTIAQDISRKFKVILHIVVVSKGTNKHYNVDYDIKNPSFSEITLKDKKYKIDPTHFYNYSWNPFTPNWFKEKLKRVQRSYCIFFKEDTEDSISTKELSLPKDGIDARSLTLAVNNKTIGTAIRDLFKGPGIQFNWRIVIFIGIAVAVGVGMYYAYTAGMFGGVPTK